MTEIVVDKDTRVRLGAEGKVEHILYPGGCHTSRNSMKAIVAHPTLGNSLRKALERTKRHPKAPKNDTLF